MGLTDEITLLITGTNRSGPAITDFKSGLASARAEVSLFNQSLRDLQVSADALQFTKLTAGFAAVRDEAAMTTTAIRGMIVAMGDMSLVSRTTSFMPPMPVAGIANADANMVQGRVVRSTITRDVEQSAFASRFSRTGGVLGTGMAEQVGLGGRVMNAALGPEGLMLGGLLYGGYRAAKASNQFQSTLAGLASATGVPFSQVRPVGQGALTAGASGTAQFSPSQMVQQGQQFLAAGVSGQTYGKIENYLSQGAALLSSMPGANGQDVFGSLTASVTDLANTYGQGKDTSVKAFKAFGDMTVAADQFSKSNPGAFAANLAKMLPVGQAARIPLPEMLGFAIAETHTGESTRFSATNFSRLISNVSLRGTPTPAQQRAALGLGVEIGPNALQTYGGLTGWLQAVQAGAAKDKNAQADLYALSGTSNAFRGISEVLKQMETGGLQRFVSGLGASPGLIGRQFPQLMTTSPDAQWKGITNQFNTDLINTGKTLTDTFQPDLIQAAKSILDGAQKAGDVLGSLGTGPGGKGGLGDSILGAVQTMGFLFNPTSPDFMNPDKARADAFRELSYQRQQHALAQPGPSSPALQGPLSDQAVAAGLHLTPMSIRGAFMGYRAPDGKFYPTLTAAQSAIAQQQDTSWTAQHAPSAPKLPTGVTPIYAGATPGVGPIAGYRYNGMFYNSQQAAVAAATFAANSFGTMQGATGAPPIRNWFLARAMAGSTPPQAPNPFGTMQGATGAPPIRNWFLGNAMTTNAQKIPNSLLCTRRAAPMGACKRMRRR